MRHGTLIQVRALALLVAFGIGLLGQAAAALAMPMQMQMQMPQQVVAADSFANGVGLCPGCAQAVPAMSASCMSAFCSVPLAVLPSGPMVAPCIRETGQPIGIVGDAGITIRPDLGPPRSIRHS